MVAETAENSVLMYSLEAERRHWIWLESSETSKPVPSDTPPPNRSHLLILPRQFYQPGTKYSNL